MGIEEKGESVKLSSKTGSANFILKGQRVVNIGLAKKFIRVSVRSYGKMQTNFLANPTFQALWAVSVTTTQFCYFSPKADINYNKYTDFSIVVFQ